MSYPPRQQLRFKRKKGYFSSGKIILIVLLTLFAAGCAASIPMNKLVTLSGTFTGSTSEGHPVSLTLHQEKDAVTGQGSVGEESFVLSGLTSLHGPMVITYENGGVAPAYIMLSPDGQDIKMQGLGGPLHLIRGGEPLSHPSGPFEGRYAYSGSPRIYLSLTQGGELVAGTGFVEGKAVAVVGRVTESHKASGTLLFSDESRARVKVVISEDGQTLHISGLGSLLQMKRQ